MRICNEGGESDSKKHFPGWRALLCHCLFYGSYITTMGFQFQRNSFVTSQKIKGSNLFDRNKKWVIVAPLYILCRILGVDIFG